MRSSGTPASPNAVRPPLAVSHSRGTAASPGPRRPRRPESAGRRDAGGLARRRGLIARPAVVGKIAQHGPGRLAQQGQGGGQHAVLQRRIVGPAERVAERERHEEGARRLHLLAVLAHHADRDRRDALGLERAASTPPVCVQNGQVGVTSATSTPSSRSRRATSGPVSFSMPGHLALGAHERVAVRRQAADGAAADQLRRRSIGKEMLTSRMIAPGRSRGSCGSARCRPSACRRRSGDTSARRGRTAVAAPVQTGRGDDGHAAGGERTPQRRERRALVDLHRQGEEVLAVALRQPVQTRHREAARPPPPPAAPGP